MTCNALFNSDCFIFGVLPVVMVGYWLVPDRRWKLTWLSAASLVFYSFWDWRFTGLLVGASAIDFFVALQMKKSAHPRRWLIASLAIGLGVLAVFKYFVFAVESARSVLTTLGVDSKLPYYSIVLPLGISFYTFHTITYVVDVYRGVVEPTREYTKYLAFVTLFPALVAGPIIRYADMSPQLDDLPKRLSAEAAQRGLWLFGAGMFGKVVIADTIARHIDRLWSDAAGLSTVDAWIASTGFTLQIYFDFAAYGLMAMGVGTLLGLRVPENFRAPFQSRTPSDFWRRWHVSLMNFFRDYVYVPLGGNRGAALKTVWLVVAIFLLSGLWHGAAWHFVLWGLSQGLVVVAFLALKRQWTAMPVALQRGATFLAFSLGMVLFRAPDTGVALDVYAAMFVPRGDLAPSTPMSTVPILGAALLLTQIAKPAQDLEWNGRRDAVAVVAAVLLFWAVVFMHRATQPFIYFQF